MPGRFANLEFEDEHSSVRSQHEHILAREPTSEEHFARAREHHHWRRFEEALRLFTRALNEDRNLVPAWVGQVQMLVELGEYHEARVWSDKSLDLFRENGELLAAKAQACARLRDFKAGLACSDGSLRAPGSSPWRWQARGELLVARNDRLARECFQKALAEPAADWFDRVIIARICSYYRQASSALRYLKDAIALEPTHGCIWFEVGICQRELGLAVAARDAYERCLELAPDFVPARRALDELDAGVPLLRRVLGIFRGWSSR